MRGRLLVVAVLAAGCSASSPGPASPSPVAFHGMVAAVSAAAVSAGFTCRPAGQPYGFVVTECRRGDVGPSERDLVDVYARADGTIAGLDLIAETVSGGPAIAELAQTAFAPVLDAAAASTLVASVGSTAGTNQPPATLAGGLQLRIWTDGPGIDRVSLLAPDLVAVWAPAPPAAS